MAVAAEAGGDGQALEHLFEERPGRAGRGRRADLLVVEQGDHGRDRGGSRGDEGVGRRPAGHLVVDPAARQQRSVGTEDGGGRAVEQGQLPCRGAVFVDVDLLRQPSGELAVLRAAGAPDRREVDLLVEHEAALVDVAVEMDGELGDAADRLVDAHVDGGSVVEDDAAGDAEVAVEPRVEQRPAVDLHAELAPTEQTGVRARLDAQARRVGVRTDDAQWRSGRRLARASPGDQRGAAHDEPLVGHVCPRLGEPQRLEAVGQQALGGAVGRVERRR